MLMRTRVEQNSGLWPPFPRQRIRYGAVWGLRGPDRQQGIARNSLYVLTKHVFETAALLIEHIHPLVSPLHGDKRAG